MKALLILVFWIVTIITCALDMFRTSAVVGLAALVACALCYAGAAGFMGALLARRANKHRVIDLVGMGAIALPAVAAGAALMWWSGFSLRLFGIEIGGVAWALLGALSAVIVVRPEDAVKGDFPR
jgi:hypothetical protein